MIIKTNLTPQSIKSAINKLKETKKLFKNEMSEEFLKRCCEEIKNIANERLEMLDIGSETKEIIKNGWKIDFDPSKKSAFLTNNTEESCYVEFGVGIVGKSSPHSYSLSGYEYDLDSPAKRDDRSWIYRTKSEEEGNIPQEYYIKTKNGAYFTKGAPAMMFLYNAIEDFKISKRAYAIWQEVKKKYLG